VTELLDEPLFAHVLANPDDVAPRLVLADRLLELGDPRGEFIQLQCAAEHEVDAATKRDLEQRAERLRKRHLKEWIWHFREHVRRTHFQRGFVELVVTELGKVPHGLATIAAHTPLRALQITAMNRGDGARLGATEALLRLRTLDISGQRIGKADAAELFASPNLASIRELAAWGNPFGDDGFVSLAGSPHLAKLQHLHVSTVASKICVGAPGLGALAEATFVEALESLHLDARDSSEWRAVTTEAFDALTRARFLSLREWSVDRCPIGDEGAYAIAESAHLGALERLSLYYCDITEAGMLALARSKTLPSLRLLLSELPQSPEVRDALARRRE
jgi:uncharacterized protein (TIGR02996 family)